MRKRNWRIFCLAFAITGVLSVIVSSFLNVNASLNNIQVELDSSLDYYLTVKYDGVDRNGVESSDTQIASINSARLLVSDRIPDGLEFQGFIGEGSGYSASPRSDTISAPTCRGFVVLDSSKTEGWNADNSEYYHGGLTYTSSTRTVSFIVESLTAGCELTVGISTKTPTEVDDPNTAEVELRRDFYNTATLSDNGAIARSNLVHTFIGSDEIGTYKVSYEYYGDVPSTAPSLPDSSYHPANSPVEVAANVEIEGYSFSGWSTEDTTINDGHFVMPNKNVVLKGSYEAKAEEEKHRVEYRIAGEAPEGYITPKTKEYAEGVEVTLDSLQAGDVVGGYVFSGWTSDDVTLSETGFTMGGEDVVINGSFEHMKYKLSYEFQGAVLPPNADALLPEPSEHFAGDTITTADYPEADGYRFVGWYKNATFVMPEEDVVIYGEWVVQTGTFEPKITIHIPNQKPTYKKGDVVEFEIVVANPESFDIEDVAVEELLENSEFTEDNPYELINDRVIRIDVIPAGESRTVTARFVVQNDGEFSYTNEAEIIGAIASNGYDLKDASYKASVDFLVNSSSILPPQTFDMLKGFVIVILACGALIILGTVALRNRRLVINKRAVCYSFGAIAVVAFGATVINHSFAATSDGVVSTIELTSQHTSFDAKEGGAWHIDKSADWIGDGQARIKFSVDTIQKMTDRPQDILLVFDNSGSMMGDRIDRAKRDAAELASAILKDDDNRIGVITFNTNASILSNFTNDVETISNKIGSISATGGTNYYSGYKEALNLLNDYEVSNERDLVMLFLTDGYPAEASPNQKVAFQELKSKYPINIIGIQYEMGKDVLEPITEITDIQFVASMSDLENTLFEAAQVGKRYDTFIVTDYIESEYWDLEDVSKISANKGSYKLEYDDGKPVIIWDLSGELVSGTNAELTIDINLKQGVDELLYPTNASETIQTELEETPSENITSDNTPVLKSRYQLIYEGNAPSGCTVENLPETEEHSPLSIVELSDAKLVCSDYVFRGWAIATEGVEKLNDDYIRMPSNSDVIIRALWGKASIEKDMEGEIVPAEHLYDKIADRSMGIDTELGVDYSNADAESGVYTLDAYKNEEYPVHFYRGNITNNHVLFANHCWLAYRTTTDGGTKLLYDGVPNDRMGCDNTGNDATINTQRTYYDNYYRYPLASQSYMYGDYTSFGYNIMYASSSRTFFRITNSDVLNKSGSAWYNYYYGSDVEYDEETGLYSLVNPVKYTSSNYQSAIGKYTLRNNSADATSNVAYYTVNVVGSYSFTYDIKLTNGQSVAEYDAQNAFNLGTSYSTNDDGTYKINGLVAYIPSEWKSKRNSTIGKYLCTEGSYDSCSKLERIMSVDEASYKYSDPFGKITFGKSHDGLSLVDTTTVTYSEYLNNSRAYMQQYTCGNEKAVCNDMAELFYTTSLTNTNGIVGAYGYHNTIFANDVRWDGEKYDLVDIAYGVDALQPSSTETNDHHYFCYNKTGITSCESVGYAYYRSSSNQIYYIRLTGGIDRDAAIEKMWEPIKKHTMIEEMDQWYERELSDFTGYLEDEVYCNDKTMTAENSGWVDGGRLGLTNFETMTRLKNMTPSLECSKKDAYTVDSTKGNGALIYPVGLITSDELIYAGVIKSNVGYDDVFVGKSTGFVTMSPSFFTGVESNGARFYDLTINSTGYPWFSEYGSGRLRPVVTVKYDVFATSGDGSSEYPWVVQ